MVNTYTFPVTQKQFEINTSIIELRQYVIIRNY